MIITFPLRLITLHFSQIGLTEGLTFIEIPPIPLRGFPVQTLLSEFVYRMVFVLPEDILLPRHLPRGKRHFRNIILLSK